MIDYEQLYYDLLFENKKLKKQIEMYQTLNNKETTLNQIIEMFSHYLIKAKKEGTEDDRRCNRRTNKNISKRSRQETR